MVNRKKPGPRATHDPRVVPLLALQRELGLTKGQRLFVEALAKDPEHHHTKAAIAAGASPKSAHVRATRWLKLAKVQQYYYELTAASRAEAAEQTRDAVAGLAEVLMTVTAHMRARVGDFMVLMPGGGYAADLAAIKAAPPGVVKGLKHDEAGDIDLKLVDGLGAAKTLLAHYTEQPLAGGGGNLTINAILGSLPPGFATALFRAMALASGRQPVGLLGPGAGTDDHGDSRHRPSRRPSRP